MKKFAYLRDPMFVVCCGLYLLNRILLKPNFHARFLQFWFNDTLLIPCALPVALWLQTLLRLRPESSPPSLGEISTHFLFWSVLFEVIGPHLFQHATGDPLDVLAYAGGALLSLTWWHREEISEWFAQ